MWQSRRWSNWGIFVVKIITSNGLFRFDIRSLSKFKLLQSSPTIGENLQRERENLRKLMSEPTPRNPSEGLLDDGLSIPGPP